MSQQARRFRGLITYSPPITPLSPVNRRLVELTRPPSTTQRTISTIPKTATPTSPERNHSYKKSRKRNKKKSKFFFR